MKSIYKIAEIIKNIENISSKKEKENILKHYKRDILFRDILYFIYNPYIKTNIASKKLAKEVKVEKDTELLNVYDLMNYLKDCTGKDYQIATIQDFISKQDEDLKWLFEAIAIKKLKIGITGVTINKAFEEEFIPKFDVMLSEKFVDVKKSNGKTKVKENWKKFEDKEVIVTQKLDGNRCVVFVNSDNTIKLYSREGNEMEGFKELENEFKNFPKGFVYDGEVLAKNDEGLSSKELFQKTQTVVKKKGEKKDIEFHAFDLVPVEHFTKGISDVPCRKRKVALKNIIEKSGSSLIKYVEPLYEGIFDKELIDNILEQAKDKEEEGVMVQLSEGTYECKRSSNILKYKVFETADIKCLDIYEGQGRNNDRLGGIICDYKGYAVKIGSGFSDSERIAYFDNPEDIIGKIVEIQFFEEFDDEDGNLDLRFATFKTVRDDKTEPSYY